MKSVYTLFLSVFLFVTFIHPKAAIAGGADEDTKNIISKMPQLMGNNNTGNEFWFSVPPSYYEASLSGYIKVFVSCQTDAKVKIEIPGKNFSLINNILANEVVAFDLTMGLASPYIYQYTNEKQALADVFRGYGIHVISNQPIIVYCMVRYSYTSDGWCCLPNSGLGKDYVVASYTDYNWPAGRMPGICTITAIYDNTKVDLTLGGTKDSKVQLSSNGKIYQSGEMLPVPVLNKGDVFCYMTTGNDSLNLTDITGARISSSKPVAVVSGQYCANVPIGNPWCDYIAEEQLPTETWGTLIHVPQVLNRKKPGIIRIFAKEDKTTIYRDGNQVGFIPKGTGNEGDGWIEMRIVPIDSVPHPAVYSADKPFNIVYYNPGQNEDQVASDPFEMVLTPIEQYQNDITFCTPAAKGGQGFAQNYVGLVYQLDSVKQMPDDLEFGIVSNNQIAWTKVKNQFTGNSYSYEKDYNGAVFAYLDLTLPGDGIYKIRCSSSKFACYSYGFSPYDSYGYPTATILNSLFTGDDAPPTAIISNVDKKNGIISINVEDQKNTKGVNTTISSIILVPGKSTNVKLNTENLESGSSESVNITLERIDPSLPASASIKYTDKAGNDKIISYDFEMTSVEEGNFDASGISVYPNPIENKLNIDLSNSSISSLSGLGNIEIYSTNGEKLSNKDVQISNGKLELQVENLMTGTYIVKLNIGDYKYFGRVVKK